MAEVHWLVGQAAQAYRHTLKNMVYELKKVSWPTKRKLVTYSIVVLVFMVVLGLIISLLDMGASALVKLLVL